MPLRDHFHSPWKDRYHWEGFHSGWINTLVRHLNGSILPKQYRAEPEVPLGALIEADVATWDNNGGKADGQGINGPSTKEATQTWSPPQPVQSLLVDLPDQDIYEVKIFEEETIPRLVAVIELVSPSNKDRAESRHAFISKCSAYLKKGIGVLVVDIVTSRHANLHHELMGLLTGIEEPENSHALFTVTYQTNREKDLRRLSVWHADLQMNQPLPTMPLWLTSNLAVPVDLEKTYEETCEVLRIRWE